MLIAFLRLAGNKTSTKVDHMRNKFQGTGERGYHPLRKLGVVGSGLRFAVVHDFAVAYKAVLSGLALACTFVLRQWVDFVAIVVVTAFMLASELFNTAVEALCDLVQPRFDERIRMIKDVAAAATGVAIAAWALVLGYEGWRLAGVLLAPG